MPVALGCDDVRARDDASRSSGDGPPRAPPRATSGPDDLRVPDRACFRGGDDLTWNPTAAIMVEVVSLGDESRARLGFCHGVGVEEVLLVEPADKTVEWLVRGPGGSPRSMVMA